MTNLTKAEREELRRLCDKWFVDRADWHVGPDTHDLSLEHETDRWTAFETLPKLLNTLDTADRKLTEANERIAELEQEVERLRGPEVPDLVKGKIVPSTIQLWGETFHREANLDAWFGELTAKIEEHARDLKQTQHKPECG